MDQQTIAWWPVLALLVTATISDVRDRRIPNLLTLPFLVAGVMAMTALDGFSGLGKSIAGIALAVAVSGPLCWLRAMGMGDLKLLAAVGAWLGPAQVGMALISTGLAGGVLALIWAAFHGSLQKSLDGSSELVSGFWNDGIGPHPILALNHPSARTMPYAPAIAIGTIFSFFAT